MCPAGRSQARLAVRRQAAPSGTTGPPPAKIMPRDGGPHQNCCGLWTSHDPGTDSCARQYGTGTQPAGAPAPPVSVPPPGPLWLILAAADSVAGTAPGDPRGRPDGGNTAAAMIAAAA